MHTNIQVAPWGFAKPPVTKLWSNLDSNKKRVEPNYDLLIVFLTGINVGKNWTPIKIHSATVIAIAKWSFPAISEIFVKYLR